MTTQRSRHLQTELGRQFAPFEPLWRDAMPSPTSGVGARFSAGSEQQWWRCDVPRSLPQEANLAAHRLPTDERSSRIRPILVGHAVDLAPAQPPPRTTAKSKPAPPLAQHSLRQLRAPDSDSGRRRAGHGHGRRPRRPRPSQPCGGLPTAALPDLTSAGHSGRRTADTWTLRRPHRTPDTGRVDSHAWTLVARTEHWTPDAGRGRGQGDDGTAGIRTSWATTPSDRALGRPSGFLWTAPAALGSPCRLGGEATFQRETASRTTRQLLGRSAAGQAAPRRTAVLKRESPGVRRRVGG
jgi:hypothetical protein